MGLHPECASHEGGRVLTLNSIAAVADTIPNSSHARIIGSSARDMLVSACLYPSSSVIFPHTSSRVQQLLAPPGIALIPLKQFVGKLILPKTDGG